MRPDETRVAYDGTLIDVVVERWGEHEREIVEHPGAVAIVAVDGADRVALVRQLREPVRRELLELPAGTLEHGEGAEAAARRELGAFRRRAAPLPPRARRVSGVSFRRSCASASPRRSSRTSTGSR
jgi:hypothetical protein